MLLGKRLKGGEAIELGGGLYAQLITQAQFGNFTEAVELSLRTRGAGDLELQLTACFRDSAQAAAKHAEEVLTHLASALRQAGAT